MNKLWFRRKKYGYGWYPASWEGWTVLVAFVIFQVWNFLRLDSTSHSNSDTIRPFVIETFLAVLVLIAICRFTGEPARWQWGEKKK